MKKKALCEEDMAKDCMKFCNGTEHFILPGAKRAYDRSVPAN